MKAKIAVLYPLRYVSVRKKKIEEKKNWLSLEGHGAIVWPGLTYIKSWLFAGQQCPLDDSVPRAERQLCLRESFLNIIVMPASLSLGQDLSAFPW